MIPVLVNTKSICINVCWMKWYRNTLKNVLLLLVRLFCYCFLSFGAYRCRDRVAPRGTILKRLNGVDGCTSAGIPLSNVQSQLFSPSCFFSSFLFCSLILYFLYRQDPVSNCYQLVEIS